MKKKLIFALVVLLVPVLSFAMAPKKASAIPAFAQKYHYSCTVCHTVFPNLNPFGRAFWRNGFRLPCTEGTPADATQITEGLSLPNPWPIPIMVEGIITYTHNTNENVTGPGAPGQYQAGMTDVFDASGTIVTGGAFKLYTPLADSLSFYTHFNSDVRGGGTLSIAQVFASLNGLGSGFGLPSHLFNLKLGQVTTASPYFYRQAPFYLSTGPVGNGQGLNVGFDGEKGALIHHRNPGFALYGTPGYHLWYKVTVTNDQGSPNLNAFIPAYCVMQNGTNYCFFSQTEYTTNGEALSVGTMSNAMEYSYQLKEYVPTSMGQLEFGYYGATISEPIMATGIYNNETSTHSWTDRIMVNGFDIDLANDVYELGATYMVQSDSTPYGPFGIQGCNIYGDFCGNVPNLPAGNVSGASNGYSTFEIYGRYLFPTLFGAGVMLSADYAQYSWTHEDLQEVYENTFNNVTSGCTDGSVYQTGVYSEVNGGCNEGIKDALALQAEINLAYNAHLYIGYTITNKDQDNLLGTGLDFAF